MNFDIESPILATLILSAALLHSSVGHAGASGYLAAIALMGVSPSAIRPSALFINILVAFIATYKFYRVGAFSWRIFWPLALAAIPCAYAGEFMTSPTYI